MHEVSPSRALVNGVLTLAVLALGTWGVIKVAQRHWSWQPTFQAEADFSRIGGLALGDKVRLQGMEAGVVEAIRPPEYPGGPIRVGLRIDARLQPLIRADAVASIGMQNAVGPKIIEIAPGKADAPPLPSGGMLATADPIELGDMMTAGNEALTELTQLTQATKQGMNQINEITASINRGEGTLGKLVRDDAAYHQLMSLAERGERAASAIDDNLSAFKGIWPVSSYLKDRGYDDSSRLLYRPNCTRESQTLASADLFQSGTAILSDTGRATLDQFAHDFRARPVADSAEIVIAAVAGSATDDDAARILTQEQAKAVRGYLDQKFSLFDLSFFRQRKVASVGFGRVFPKVESATPPASPEPTTGPADRVELIIFTPKS